MAERLLQLVGGLPTYHFGTILPSFAIICVYLILMQEQQTVLFFHMKLTGLVFAGILYIFLPNSYYSLFVKYLIYMHVTCQMVIIYYLLLYNKDLIMLLWVHRITLADILVFLGVAALVYFTRLFLQSTLGVLWVQHLKVFTLLIIYMGYVSFYLILCVQILLILFYFLSDEQFFVFILCVLYVALAGKFLLFNVSLPRLLKYTFFNYSIYIFWCSLVYSSAYTSTIFVFLSLYLSSLCIIRVLCIFDYKYLDFNNIYFIKFLSPFYYFLIVVLQAIGIYWLGSNLELPYHIISVSALIFLLQVLLVSCHLKFIIKLLVINKNNFFLLFVVKCRLVRSPLILLWLNCFVSIVLASVLLGYLAEQNYILDNFEYATQQIQPRIRKISIAQQRRIAELFSGDYDDNDFDTRNEVTYEKSLEAFRQQLERYGPLFGKKRSEKFKFYRMARVGDHIDGLKKMMLYRMARNPKSLNAYMNQTFLIRSVGKQRFIDVKRQIPEDLVRPMFDLYLLPQTKAYERIRLKYFVREIMDEWRSLRTIHTRSFFMLWAPNKSKIHAQRELLSVNRYFQMFYELRWARKAGISLDLCKILVDLYEVVDINKIANISFHQYVNVIDKMYKDFNHEIDITLLIDPTWWQTSKEEAWWFWHQGQPVVSEQVINNLWTEIKLPAREYAEMYRHINFRMMHEKKARKALFQYPFIFDLMLKRWVPRTSDFDKIIKPKHKSTSWVPQFLRSWWG